jgi:hypothetical protein
MVEAGRIGAAETVGEMSLLDAQPRSADVIAAEAGQVVEILTADLNRLINKRPRLGEVVMRNLAQGLAKKLRQLDVRYTQ